MLYRILHAQVGQWMEGALVDGDKFDSEEEIVRLINLGAIEPHPNPAKDKDWGPGEPSKPGTPPEPPEPPKPSTPSTPTPALHVPTPTPASAPQQPNRPNNPPNRR